MKAHRIGILQDHIRIERMVLPNVYLTIMMLCETYNAFEEVENVSFLCAKGPASIAPAPKKPPRWPKLQTEDALERKPDEDLAARSRQIGLRSKTGDNRFEKIMVVESVNLMPEFQHAIPRRLSLHFDEDI